MHQHPRPPPRTASPASSPKTNPSRTNNSREDKIGALSKKNSLDLHGEEEDETSSSMSHPNGPSKDTLSKLDKIIQNFHIKAAILVLQSRISLPIIITQEGTKKVNKWFQIETDETNLFRQELSTWKQCGSYSGRPPPLIIETYIDASSLTKSQSLVLVTDTGKRYDALEALNSAGGEDLRHAKKCSEITLERWKFELGDLPHHDVYDFGSTLPTIYKKFIVFFRSLYATTKFVPAGRLVRTLTKNCSVGSPIKVNCRILNGKAPSNTFDALTFPIFENGKIPVTTDYVLGTTETPVGQVYAIVSYRQDCDFRIDNSEALLSSRFMGADEYFFQPSLGYKGSEKHDYYATESTSVPFVRQKMYDQSPGQTCESISTFHVFATSPESSPSYTQRVIKNASSELESPPPESLPKTRPMHVSRNSINFIDGNNMVRRPSVSFQPFKAGSLSSSPGYSRPVQSGDNTTPQSSHSSPRLSGVGAIVQTRNRSSLNAGSPATLRGGPLVPEPGTIIPVSSSPKPAPISRYSSSFKYRRSNTTLSPGGRSVADDDQNSSGKQSVSSSIQPGSMMLLDVGIGGISESLQSDDNISEFLKVLERQKTLKSFEKSSEVATKRTSAQLSKYQSLRESHNALTESMSSCENM
ncbi:hypothetical protein EPUL_005178 [Erysiphe pulchra]|uniref:Autophagy-related protein 13 n=1 Tax=Erysiphe pulchra TaxID=225359 RepID=A0A2S4PP44_9PEZI|nr:hypothetical protein EPUL_005178 [Erysiphe pulchra]